MIGSTKANAGLGILAVLLLALSSSAGAHPQRPSGPAKDREVLNLIRDAEERSGGLRGAFGRTEGYKTGPRAMRARARIRDLDEALKRLRYLVGHRGTLTQQREKVNEAISQGDSLEDIFARRLDLIDPLLDRWDGLKRDLNQLADIYGVPGIGL